MALGLSLGCLDEPHPDDSIPPDVQEVIDNMPRAIVDLGNGPEEIIYEEIDGMAVMEGDMVLGPVEEVASGSFRLSPIAGYDPDGPVAAAVTQFNAWPGARIPFTIDATLSAALRGRITSAITTWNNTGIVSFVPRNPQVFESYIFITGPATGMGANEGRAKVGYYPQSVTFVNLGANVSTATVRHELGHVIGLRHEQTRADRDDSIRINWSNIRPDRVANFWSHGPEAQDLDPYDISSLMHYGNNNFRVSTSQATIVPAGCSFNIPLAAGCTITPSSTPTVSDVRGVIELYSGAPFRLRNSNENRCLRPRNGSSTAGANVSTSSCPTNSDSRKWYRLSRSGNAGDMVVNRISRLCLTVPSSGNQMIQMPCTGSAQQQFDFVPNGGGYQLRNTGTTRCVRKRPQDSNAIISVSCTSSMTRRWFMDN